MSTRVWSDLQKAVFRAAISNVGSLLIDAKAGAAKTTTVVETINQWMPANPGKSVILVAFNKNIAEDFATKVPAGCVSSTLHAFCFRAIKSAMYGKLSRRREGPLDEFKLGLHATKLVKPWYEKEEAAIVINDLKKLYPLLKGTMTALDDLTAIDEVIRTYGLQVEHEDSVKVLWDLNQSLLAEEQFLSFDEMLSWILDKGIPLPKFDLVCVDESQDMNRLQIEILKRMVKDGGMHIVVGDPHQAIYAFRGADAKAMERMKTEFNIPQANCLPLSISYRCAKSIIAEANVYVTDIYAAPWAVEGQVLKVDATQYQATLNAMVSGDMGICRVNAKLVGAAMFLIRQGRKAIIRGKEIGKDIIKLLELMAKHAKSEDLIKISKELAEYQDEQVRRLYALNRNSQAEMMADKCETLIALISEEKDYTSLVALIKKIFSDESEGVIFSSIHKSKGLEATTVVILGPEINSFFMERNTNPLQQEQERNLMYVAITRAKSKLVFQTLPTKNPPKMKTPRPSDTVAQEHANIAANYDQLAKKNDAEVKALGYCLFCGGKDNKHHEGCETLRTTEQKQKEVLACSDKELADMEPSEVKQMCEYAKLEYCEHCCFPKGRHSPTCVTTMPHPNWYQRGNQPQPKAPAITNPKLVQSLPPPIKRK